MKQPPKDIKKYIANGLTTLRIVLAPGLLLAPPSSAAFWACYLCAGASDLLDGAAARAFKSQSPAGAKLDSAADAVFGAAIAAYVLINTALPTWMWLGAACVAALRFGGYGIGFHKYRTFSSLHTYANKATGGLIFAFPLLYHVLGLNATGAVLLVAALASSAEEVAITVKSKTLNRDCKGLFEQLSHRRQIPS